MPSRTIAIGDIHGCSQALHAILDAAQPTAADTIVLLGDYVDRGPDTRGVIDLLLELERRCRLIPLLGNHELMLLEAIRRPDTLRLWLECGGLATIKSYGGQLGNFPPEHLAFLRRCRRYFETASHFFVHANYAADMPLDEQPDYLLFWEHLHSCPPGPHDNDKIAVVGHTAQPTGEVLDLGHVICLDTFCHGGGWLTALEPDTQQLWQADREGNLRPRTEGPARRFRSV